MAGLLLLDVLLNVPLFSPWSPAGSLLAPSIDLLVLAACCMGIAQTGGPTRRSLRIGLAVLAAVLVACEAGLRFGWGAGGHLLGSGPAMRAAASWVACLLLAAAVGLAGFALSGPTVRGLEAPLARSLLLLAVSLATILQVVSGRRLFTASVIPRLISLIR
jgi:hypothetical protein